MVTHMETTATPTALTADSLALFLALARNAGNWSGTPILDELTADQKGNLSDLKKKKLIRVFLHEGCRFAEFLPAGDALALAHGVDIASYRW